MWIYPRYVKTRSFCLATQYLRLAGECLSLSNLSTSNMTDRRISPKFGETQMTKR